ncbi:O-antigen ligase family protein [Massilia sp. H-1]|nr:O-antigen ligase family protein [Massilia sp. H-1]
MLFTVPIIELYYSRRKVLMASVLGVLCLVVYVYLDQLLALLPSNRILELLDLSQSTSANKRHHLTMYAMNTIAQFPVFGDYASYNPGFYSHNVLSAWVDTGLFGFLFVLAILVLPIAQMLVRGYFLPEQSGIFILALTFACSTLLLLATSHYFTDMAIGAALGSYSRYRYGRKHGPHRPPDLGPPAPRHPHLHQAVPETGPARV